MTTTMTRPTLGERLRVLRLAAGRGAPGLEQPAGLRSRARLSFRRADLGDLRLVPQNLRTADASFAAELAGGEMGLAGALVRLSGRSPFDMTPPDKAWAAELHGFAWLRHLGAAGTPAAVAQARTLIAAWIERERAQLLDAAVAHRPQVVARRVQSWLSAAGFVLEDAEPSFYGVVLASLERDVGRLDALRRGLPDGRSRLEVLIALVTAAVAMDASDRQLALSEAALLNALGRQVGADGALLDRDPTTVLALLCDLLPLKACYASHRAPPPALGEATARMTRFLRHLRLGDGTLARCNSHGHAPPELLATVLALEAAWPEPLPVLQRSAYARLARGDAEIVMDCGRAPPLEHAGRAHASCLAFEMSSGVQRLITSCGSPRDGSDAVAPRASSCHSTLVLAARSSARLVSFPALARLIGAAAIAGPPTVTAEAAESDGALSVTASHDGYRACLGLVHTRQLTLAADGRRLDGRDTVAPPSGVLRTARDVPLAIHFHLAVDALATTEASGNAATIELADGQLWRLAVTGARASIEPSTDFAHLLGPRPSRQVVLRAACPGEHTVSWALERRA